MELRIVPYRASSKSARLLAEKLSELQGKKVFRGVPKHGRLNVMWGWAGDFDGDCLNPPSSVAIARNKLSTFKVLCDELPVPEFTEDKAVAEGWINQGKRVLARTVAGQGGSGIVVCDSAVVDAPLYTVYMKKKKEFRVHVALGLSIVYEKRRRTGAEHDYVIRSHRRGWVFCRESVEEPAGLRELCTRAIDKLGLHFGGVDVIWNEKNDKLLILEVNTAPGIEGTTVDFYASKILEAR